MIRIDPDRWFGLAWEHLTPELEAVLRERHPHVHAKLLTSWEHRGRPRRAYMRETPNGFELVDPSSDDPAVNPNARRPQR